MLAAALGPHLSELSDAARARAEAEAEAERERAEAAAMRRLSEDELMALIFEHLDPDNPRVVKGIDFERIVICEAVAPVEPPEAALALPDGVPPVVPGADVVGARDHLSARPGRGGGLLERRILQIRGDDARPARGERRDRRASDPAGGSTIAGVYCA